jgi:hypothetical protein
LPFLTLDFSAGGSGVTCFSFITEDFLSLTTSAGLDKLVTAFFPEGFVATLASSSSEESEESDESEDACVYQVKERMVSRGTHETYFTRPDYTRSELNTYRD